MDTSFKALFFFGVLLFALISVGFFMLILRILLVFNPQLHVMGMTVML